MFCGRCFVRLNSGYLFFFFSIFYFGVFSLSFYLVSLLTFYGMFLVLVCGSSYRMCLLVTVIVGLTGHLVAPAYVVQCGPWWFVMQCLFSFVFFFLSLSFLASVCGDSCI